MPRRSQRGVRSASMTAPPSEAEGGTVGAGIGAANEAAVGIEPDTLRVSEEVVPLVGHVNIVAARGELNRHLWPVASFQAERASRRSPGAAIDPARRLHARLRAHAAVETARDEGGLRLRLAFASHRPVDEARAAALEIHGGDERVQGALAG